VTASVLGETGLWVDRRGEGPPVLLIAGLGDPAEAWAMQLDSLSSDHLVVAFDNRGVGRSPLPAGDLTVASMADDAASVLEALGLDDAHVVGFSGGSLIAQELAMRHQARVRSLTLVSTWAEPDRYFRAVVDPWRWMVERAPGPREFLEAFYVWIYTARAHEDGSVARFVDEALAFPHPQSDEALRRQLDAFAAHAARDRLAAITAPTLVVAGSEDVLTPPRLGRVVADLIPGARFVVLEGEAHQPFQESPAVFDALVSSFWHDLPTVSKEPASAASDDGATSRDTTHGATPANAAGTAATPERDPVR